MPRTHNSQNCEDAFDRLRYQGLQDGTMEITYAWEEAEVSGPTNQRYGISLIIPCLCTEVYLGHPDMKVATGRRVGVALEVVGEAVGGVEVGVAMMTAGIVEKNGGRIKIGHDMTRIQEMSEAVVEAETGLAPLLNIRWLVIILPHFLKIPRITGRTR